MTWRDIVAGDINWRSVLPRERARGCIWRLCAYPHDEAARKKWGAGEWSEKTLGEICDMGVREWERKSGWGATTTDLFKRVLRSIAANPNGHAIAPDAFDPETM